MQQWEFSADGFPIQWHITVECDKKCRHCYTTDEKTYEKELKNVLDTKTVLAICERIIEFKNGFNIPVSVSVTGGHPLLRSDYRDILSALRKQDIGVEILGNPSRLEKEMDFLRSVDITGYQISLDGDEKIHDSIRGKGAFQEAMRGIECLKANDINADVMFTLSKLNMDKLEYVSDLCIDKGVRRFSFDRIVPMGRATGIEDSLPSAKEYKEFLLKTFEHYVSRSRENHTTMLALKDQLWKPLLYEMGIFKPRKVDKIISGCPVGVSGMTILADGTALPCRRLPIEIGKLPEQSIEEIFLKSKKMNELREYGEIEGCGECEINSYCRGNRCIAYATTGNYFAKDPQCWRVKE